MDTDVLYGPEMDAQLPLVRPGVRDLTVDAVRRAGYTIQDVFDLAAIHKAERASASWRQRVRWGVTLRYAILATNTR